MQWRIEENMTVIFIFLLYKSNLYQTDIILLGVTVVCLIVVVVVGVLVVVVVVKVVIVVVVVGLTVATI